MDAKKMFKELDCHYHQKNNVITYNRNIISGDFDFGFYITFHPNKTIQTNIQHIDMPLLKAINKQCEELGWFDDPDN